MLVPPSRDMFQVRVVHVVIEIAFTETGKVVHVASASGATLVPSA